MRDGTIVRKGPARKFDHDEARRLRAQGMTYAAIGEALGVSGAAVQFACNPGQKALNIVRNRARQRRGRCADCGARISSNASVPAERCAPCAGLARATSVRADGWLRCTTCREWKQPSAFYRAVTVGRRARGWRHEMCKACQNAGRAVYRSRNKVPCEDCGTPCEGKGRPNSRTDAKTGARVPLDPNRPYLCSPCSMRRIRAAEREAVPPTGTAA